MEIVFKILCEAYDMTQLFILVFYNNGGLELAL